MRGGKLKTCSCGKTYMTGTGEDEEPTCEECEDRWEQRRRERLAMEAEY